MGGSTGRIKLFAKFMQHELKDHLKVDKEPCNMSKSDRYVLYKVGPVLAVNVSNNERLSLTVIWLICNLHKALKWLLDLDNA